MSIQAGPRTLVSSPSQVWYARLALAGLSQIAGVTLTAFELWVLIFISGD